jgi:hypothetical protein
MPPLTPDQVMAYIQLGKALVVGVAHTWEAISNALHANTNLDKEQIASLKPKWQELEDEVRRAAGL